MQKRFSILGDSISTFAGCNPAGYHVFYEGDLCERSGVTSPSDTWWSHVVRHFGGEVLAVDAFSGSMVDGVGFPAASSPERVAALAGPHGEAPDVVIAFIGINDYGWGGARAQVAARSHAMPPASDTEHIPEAIVGLAPADAAEQFGRAYRTMLQRVRDAYPQARVYCCTLLPGRQAGVAHPMFAYRLRGVHLDRYNDAIRAAAAATGCLVADVRALGYEYESLEGTHPTARGMRQFAALVTCAIERADAAAPDSPAKLTPPSVGESVDAGVEEEACALAENGVDTQAGQAGGARAENEAEGRVGEGGGARSGQVDAPFAGAPRAVEWCDRPACIGCPFLRGEGNAWTCACDRPDVPDSW